MNLWRFMTQWSKTIWQLGKSYGYQKKEHKDSSEQLKIESQVCKRVLVNGCEHGCVIVWMSVCAWAWVSLFLSLSLSECVCVCVCVCVCACVCWIETKSNFIGVSRLWSSDSFSRHLGRPLSFALVMVTSDHFMSFSSFLSSGTPGCTEISHKNIWAKVPY